MLRQRLADALAGRGSLVLVGGEAGIGKTTLVAWLAAEARRRGARVLEGDCYDLAVTPPYGPWLDAFDAVPAAHRSGTSHPLRAGAEGEAIASQSELFEQITAFLAALAATQPVVLALEDLHWSDPASLELLRHLGRGIDAHGLLLIGTYRVDELTRRHPLFRLLPRLVREANAERIDLAALTDDDVEALVASRYSLAPHDRTRLATYLRGRAGGNPFYLTETLRTLEIEHLLAPTEDRWRLGNLDRVPVPPLVRQVIEGRLAKLDDDARRLLEVAAVIGQEVPLDLWQLAGDAGGDRLVLVVERAIEAHLIREVSDPTSVGFTHALVRETLADGLSLLRRRMLHRRVAEILVDRPDPPPSVVASHFARADDPRAIDWLVRAGERALALYAPRDAAAALTRAHELAGRFSRNLPLAAYRARAAAWAMLGEFDRARRDHELVLERGRAAGDRRTAWQALLDLGMLWAERDYERTGGYYRAALDLARTLGDDPMVAHSLNHVANWHANLDEPDLALPLHREALSLFEACGDRNGIADTLDFLGLANYLSCDLVSSTGYCERALALLRDRGDRRRVASCLAILAVNGGDLTCLAAPVYREATYWIGCGEESLAIARDIGWPAGEALAHFALSIATCARGDLGRALGHAEAALAIAERVDHLQWTVAARLALGAVWMELLDAGRAAAELERGLVSARTSGSRFWTCTMAAALASLQVAAGDLDRAAATLGTVVWRDQPRRSMGQRQCRFAQAELALARDDPERALAIADELTETRPNPSLDHGVPQLIKLRGDALARLRRLDEAERAYLAARDAAALFGYRPLLWRIDAARGRLQAAAGRTAAADAAFRSARAVIEELAETVAEAPIRERFRARASARLPAAPTGEHVPAAARLSPRELDVLRLLAEGKTDREIADALRISPRTVMRHVAGILDKLGVPSRTAAATLAIRRNIV